MEITAEVGDAFKHLKASSFINFVVRDIFQLRKKKGSISSSANTDDL